MKQKMYVLAMLIVVSALLLSGCTGAFGGNNIKDITTNPGKYEGSTVTVSGKVIEVAADITNPNDVAAIILKASLYKINDGSTSIYIKSSKKPPKIGDQITARGVVGANEKGVYIDATATE